MELDPAVIIPAILFTVVAIYLASSYFNKKVEAPVNKKKRRVVEEEKHEVCSSGFVSVQNVEPRVEKPPVIEEVKPAVVAKAEPVPVVAPAVEEVAPAVEEEVAPAVEEVRPVETLVSGHQITEVEVGVTFFYNLFACYINLGFLLKGMYIMHVYLSSRAAGLCIF